MCIALELQLHNTSSKLCHVAHRLAHVCSTDADGCACCFQNQPFLLRLASSRRSSLVATCIDFSLSEALMKQDSELLSIFNLKLAYLLLLTLFVCCKSVYTLFFVVLVDFQACDINTSSICRQSRSGTAKCSGANSPNPDAGLVEMQLQQYSQRREA